MGKSFRMTSMSRAGDIIVELSGMFGRYMMTDRLVDIAFHGAELQLLRDVECEGVDQEGLCRGFAYPARAQIEQRFLAELPDGGTMAAFHVVGIDLELGFAVDGRPFADHEIVILLESIGLLRILMHIHLAVEYAGG